MMTPVSYPDDFDSVGNAWGSDSEPEYANHDADYAIFSTWARSILPGIDMSTGAVTLAFSDHGQATCRVTEAGDPEFNTQEGVTPHNNSLFSGDAIKFSLDEPVGHDTFGREGKWYTFGLQHVMRSYYLMFREDTGG